MMTSTWDRYQEFWIQLWLKRPGLWVLSQGLLLAVIFAAIGLATPTSWVRVAFIWAVVMIGLVSAQWWRGRRRADSARIN